MLHYLRVLGARRTVTRYLPFYLARKLHGLVRPEVVSLEGFYRQEEEDGFDREHGTDTTEVVEATELDGGDPEARNQASRYRATLLAVLRTSLERLPIRFEDFTFVDVGCGKGRALLVASHYPFRRIEGVELSPRLCRVASDNVSRYRAEGQRCHQISVVCADARSYEIPPEDTVFFLYEPFGPGVAEAFFRRVEQSLEARPRKLVVCWVGHLRPDFLESFRWLKSLGEVRSPHRFWRIFCFATEP